MDSQTVWMSLNWKKSKKGNLYLKYASHLFIIFEQKGYYKLNIDNKFGKMKFVTINNAKLHCFKVKESLVKK